MHNHPDFKEKLPLYKTAWTDTYNCYMELISTHHDELGNIIIVGRRANHPNDRILFRPHELTKYCL